jgi:hypothetical protein
MSMLLTRLFLKPLLMPQPARRERGDVPGWVLITVMTAGLVVGIMAVAAPQLESMLKKALESVSGK